MKSEAIGAFEAACLLGTHWTKPAIMAEQGRLSSRVVGGVNGRSFSVFRLDEIEQNYREYEEAQSSGSPGRPRASLHLRPDALRALAAKDRPKIEFDDAIGFVEAAKILGVHTSFVTRLAMNGEIVGRILWSRRAGRSRLWIFSRLSCERRAADSRKLEREGRKVGRPRSKVTTKATTKKTR